MIDIVLASTSPRRQELLRQIGLEFVIVPVDVDEEPLTAELPASLVARLSASKAAAGAAQHEALGRSVEKQGTEPRAHTPSYVAGAPHTDGVLVIAADTVVVVDGEVLGKPRDRAENRAFLERLSGRAHKVLTGHTLQLQRLASAAVVDTTVAETTVRFRSLDTDELERYLDTTEGADKAGGYAVQGRGAVLVRAIDGCYSNVVGLSVPTVVESARRLGVALV